MRYSGNSPWMDKNWLYNEYIVNDRSTEDIASEYGCKRNTIQCWLSKHGIKKDKVKRIHRSDKQYWKYDYLYNEYVINKRTITSIAAENNVSCDTIRAQLLKNGIETHRANQHKLTEEQDKQVMDLYMSGLSMLEVCDVMNIGISSVKTALKNLGVNIRSLSEAQDIHNGKHIDNSVITKDWLYKKHWIENMSITEISKMLGVSAKKIYRTMRINGVNTKTNSQSKIGLMTGSKHPNWKGGVTPLYALLREYFTTNISPLAAKRDGYTCSMCGKTHTILNVHHIIPFSKIIKDIISENPEINIASEDGLLAMRNIIVNDSRFADIDNLTTLCKQCHILIHSNKIISSQADDKSSEGSETIESKQLNNCK